MNAIGDQRRGQGVAFAALVADAIEGEADLARAVERAAGGAKGLAHASRPAGPTTAGLASPVL